MNNKSLTNPLAQPASVFLFNFPQNNNIYLLRERNVLFNDALNTFYLRLYGVRHMVKDHSDSEKGNPLSPHRLLKQGFFYMHHPTDRITHTTAFVTPVVEHWLEREIAQWVHPMKDRSDDPPHHERMLYLWAISRSYLFIDALTKKGGSNLQLVMGYI